MFDNAVYTSDASYETHLLDPLLKPKSVALIGASRRRNAVGNDMVRNLIPAGFDGRIYPVNPSYESLYGWTCYPDIMSLPETVDLAILSVPNRVLEEVVDQAIASGARALVIFASAELEGEEESDRLRDRIAEKARKAGIPICGANGMGFFNPIHGFRAFSAFHPDPIEIGGLTYIAQSGSLLQALLFNDERLRFNLAVSTGQELVTNAADYMDYALNQPETRVIAIALEAIRDPDGFVKALKKAYARKIPVIILKLGKSEAGARFALSHTGAIAGDAKVYEALFRRYGVISVNDLAEMAATAKLMLNTKLIAKGGVSAILDSGGERQLIVDVASEMDVPFADISERTQTVLKENLDYGLTAENPVDAWGTGRDYEQVFQNCLTALMQDDDTALCIFVVDLGEELDLHAGYAQVCEAVARSSDKPLVVMTNYSAWSHRKHAIRLARLGISVLDGTVTSFRAIKHALDYRDFLAQRKVIEDQHIENPRAQYWRELLANRKSPLTEDEGYELLADYGIQTPSIAIVESEAELKEAVDRVGLPLVAKTAEPGILHKSDVGGVVLNIETIDQAKKAYEKISKLGPRVLFSSMHKGTAEMAFGLVQDEQFGSFVMVAFGGIWIEVLKDSQLAMVPVDQDVALRRINELKIAKVLDGVRGEPPCDKQALVNTYINLSNIAQDLGDYIAEMDINPVLVSPEGVVAVDSLIVPKN